MGFPKIFTWKRKEPLTEDLEYEGCAELRSFRNLYLMHHDTLIFKMAS